MLPSFALAPLEFSEPTRLLLLLAVLPVSAAAWFVGRHRQETARRQYGGGRRLWPNYRERPRGRSPALLRLSGWLLVAALPVVALAGPVLTDSPATVVSGDMAVVFAVDVSHSQSAQDYRRSGLPCGGPQPGTQVIGPYGSRLEAARSCILQVLSVIAGNDAGLVKYTGSGFAQSELTSDLGALTFVLENWLTAGSAPGSGSNIASGLKEALAIFERGDGRAPRRVIVLLSDGGFTGSEEELKSVAAEVVRRDIRLIVLGFGGSRPMPLPQYEKGRFKGYLLDEKGDPILVTLEESRLKALADATRATGGRYIRVTSSTTAKDDLEWARTLGATRVELHGRKLYPYLLLAAAAVASVLAFPLRRRCPDDG